MHLVSRHGNRSFALLGKTTPADVKWSLIAPRTYDHSKIARAPRTEHAVTLTLVGPGGSRVVETRTQWFLDAAWGFQGVRSAIEINDNKEHFRIALPGKYQAAKWIALASRDSTDASWVTAQGFNLASPADVVLESPPTVTATKLWNSGVEALSFYNPATNQTTTLLRRDGKQIRQLIGSPIGAVDVDSEKMLVVEHDGSARGVIIY